MTGCPMDYAECPLHEEQQVLRAEQAELRRLLDENAKALAELSSQVRVLTERLAPIHRGFWAGIALVFGIIGASVLALIVRRP